jgi:hypothetical protein
MEAACKFINHKIQASRRRLSIILISALFATVALGALMIEAGQAALAIGLLVAFTAAQRTDRELKRWYAHYVIPRVVAALGDDLKYSRASTLTSAEFNALNLFKQAADIFRSEDEITGERRKVWFSLHEVRASKRNQNGKHTTEEVFFQGVVVKLEFNKNFKGHTTLISDRDSKLLGGLLGDADDWGGRQLVSFGDPEFEQSYSVYSTDPQEAHYILTPKLMELIVRARREMGELRWAFYANALYVTVPSSANRFEITLSSTVTPETVAADLVSVVQLAEQLIDTLELETRIWTRA